MQKLCADGFDPQRIPKDLLIWMLSYAAENTFNIALVCVLFSKIVKMQRYWEPLVRSRLTEKLGEELNIKRIAQVNVFCTAPYDILIGQIPPLTLRQQVGWIFAHSQVVFTIKDPSVYHNNPYVTFMFYDKMNGRGIKWLVNPTDVTDFALEFGCYFDFEYIHEGTYLRWFPFHRTLRKQLRKAYSPVVTATVLNEIWDPTRKQVWRGNAKYLCDSFTLQGHLVPNGDDLSGKWYYLYESEKSAN